MKEVTKTIYVSKDGREFFDANECILHEYSVDFEQSSMYYCGRLNIETFEDLYSYIDNNKEMIKTIVNILEEK